jgi:ADP-ribose pyrophosphatase YjhB (NUDIX family)
MSEPNPLIGSYIEPGYLPSPVFLSAEEYGRVLDSIVVSCVDVALTHNGKVLLGKRTWHPQADWWLIGGRMKPGEELEASASRNLERELGLTIPSQRYSYLTTIAAAWRLRRHAPADHGTHTVAIVLAAELSDSEAAAIKLNEEYSAHQWLTPDEVLADKALHPALHQCAQALTSL